MFLFGSASIQSAASLATVQGLGSQYSLTVALGDFNSSFGTNLEPGTLRLGFLVGETFVKGGDITLDAATASAYSPEGTLRDYTFNYNSTAADAGKTLKIFFGQTGASNAVGFDNVRLNVTALATPEPSTYAMMALGLVALCVLGAKRRKDGQAI